jgi:hypothetical protein
MTSANVMHYVVKNKLGVEVAHYRQNFLCKNTVKNELSKHVPLEDFSLYLIFPDEDEVDHLSEEMKLSEYLSGKKVIWIDEHDDEIDEHDDEID